MVNNEMPMYIGAKLVQAKPMSRGEYNAYRGWPIPCDEDQTAEGYLVRYQPDGYESWSPKEVFEQAYRQVDGLSFGLAIEAMKQGRRVTRRGWNGKGMYVFLAHGMDFNTDADLSELDDQDVEVLDCLVMRTATGAFCPGWLASQTDMLADDWMIVPEVAG